MSTTADLKTLRLARRAQWEAGLVAGLRPIKRTQDELAWQIHPAFANTPDILCSPGCGSTPVGPRAVPPWLGSDPLGGLWWRDRDGAMHEIHSAAQAPVGASVCAVPPAAVLANASSIVFGRSWLYSARGTIIVRHDAASLQPDAEFEFEGKVRDIASDANDGLHVLCERVNAPGSTPGSEFFLQHLCASGKRLPARKLAPATCATLAPSQLTYLAHPNLCVLLSADGSQLSFVAHDGAVRTLAVAKILPAVENFCASWLDSDRLGRLLLLGAGADGATQCVLCDAGGDVSASVSANGAQAAVIAGETLYLLTDAVVLRLSQTASDGSALGSSSSAGELSGSYMTPLMHSPRRAGAAGWLRAHLEAYLPAGASLHVSVLRCDDAEAAESSRAVAANSAQTPAQRIAELCSLPGWRVAANYDFAGQSQSNSASRTYEIPLFDDDARWCRLLIELVAAPLSALPQLQSCTVLYPNISLMQYLPAIFNGASVAENRAGSDDPFLRLLVGVWESQTQGLDYAIGQSGARYHPDSAPPNWLDFLARKLDCPWHNALPVASKRRILQAADALAQARGTQHGLQLLLRALLPGVNCEVQDICVEHGFVTLGGKTAKGQIAGSCLPALLTGLPKDSARLSRKAVLGALRLGSAGEIEAASVVYQRFLGQIKITLHCVRDPQLAELLPTIIASVLPAAIQARIEWRAEPRAWQLDSGLQLDDPSVGRLNQSLRLNRSILSGKRKRQLPAGGILPGFNLS